MFPKYPVSGSTQCDIRAHPDVTISGRIRISGRSLYPDSQRGHVLPVIYRLPIDLIIDIASTFDKHHSMTITTSPEKISSVGCEFVELESVQTHTHIYTPI